VNTLPPVRLTLVRNATVLVELGGRRILVDPALDDAGARPPVGNSANPRRNPLVPLPFPAVELLRGLDGVVITHLHRDHLDAAAERLLPRDVPVLCQPADEERLLDLGLEARPVEDELDWLGLHVARTGARHTLDRRLATELGPVNGFVLADLYVASDSVWCDKLEAAIEKWRPRVTVVNAGAASFLDSGPISMTTADVAEVAARVPTVVTVHLEAMNHCPMTRAELRAAVPSALVPDDGQTLEF
jgi:L-ascorbate metabolism protein UlaG (beta-lactamase superfamily)